MKKSRALKRTLLCTILSAGMSAWVNAQDPSPAQAQTPSHLAKEQSGLEMGQPLRFNKASGLLGMQVKNSAEEHLGKIRDIVFDLKGDRIAYAVLGTGSGLFGSEKLHAVPLRAFEASADGTYLILHADKDKLARAEGFDRNNWPSVTSPAWGAEPFWQESPATTRVPELTLPKPDKTKAPEPGKPQVPEQPNAPAPEK